MATQLKPAPDAPRISPKNFISREFQQGENERLWPRVWQVACRVEELPNLGSYVTYNVGTESIVVLRNKEGIVAFHNVCPHRGRRLADGCGRTTQLRCKYHGWSFDLEGTNTSVQDRNDWQGGLDDERINLWPVRCDTWGGFVFICIDDEAESLSEYLETLPQYLDPFEFEKLRYRWKVELRLNCNWKVALEAFMEGYHVAATHPQVLTVQGDDYTQSYAQGKHSHFGYWQMTKPMGTPSPRLKMEDPADARAGVIEFFRQMEEDLSAIFTDRDYDAAKKIMDVLPADVDPATAFGTAVELGRKAAEEEGCGYPPDLDYEKLGKAGADWHIFPNCVTLPWFDGALWYRARPDHSEPDNPDKCVFEIWSLKRYGEGKEPSPPPYKLITNPQEDSVCLILDQDIANMMEVQAGMKSSKFAYARPNPVQEMEVINMHKVIEEYVLGQQRPRPQPIATAEAAE